MIRLVSPILDLKLRKGSAQLLHLSLLEARPRHGDEINQLIESESGGVLSFNVASLYPFVYRLEKPGCIQGRWLDKAGQRRRRYYQLTSEGRKVLRAQGNNWKAFVAAIRRIAEVRYA